MVNNVFLCFYGFFSKLIKHEWIPERPGLWIPDSSVIWIPDSTVWIPDSKSLDSGFLNQQKVGFREKIELKVYGNQHDFVLDMQTPSRS
jgi:hypothetical protein